MAKIIILTALTLAGKEYLPSANPVEVSDESAERLVKRGLAQMADGSSPDAEPQSDELREQVETLTRERDDLKARIGQRTFAGELTDLVGIKAAFSIIGAGYDSLAKLKGADNKALTDLADVGAATVKKLGDALAN